MGQGGVLGKTDRSKKSPKTRQKPSIFGVSLEEKGGARCRVRTCDPYRVKVIKCAVFPRVSQ